MSHKEEFGILFVITLILSGTLFAVLALGGELTFQRRVRIQAMKAYADADLISMKSVRLGRGEYDPF